MESSKVSNATVRLLIAGSPHVFGYPFLYAHNAIKQIVAMLEHWKLERPKYSSTRFSEG